MLSTQDIEIVKSTIPILEQGGVAITAHFYDRMFQANPELKNVFNMSNQHTGSQRIALFEAILAYAKNIDNLAVLKTAVERIAQKHTSFDIQPDQYQIVGHHLIETFRELVPEQFTPEVEQAWTKAYGVLAGVFIGREEEIYQDTESKTGGWRGTRPFKVASKQNESESVVSFVFEPLDGKIIADYQPGQYLAVELTPQEQGKGLEYTEIRQYSLSDKADGAKYRISVKREENAHKGVVSNYLHDHINEGDTIQLHAPVGDFYFVDKQSPVVLISAGVGVTPMQSMLETLASTGCSSPVYYLHACQNKEQHSFGLRSAELCETHQWNNHTWYMEGAEKDSGIYAGLMNLGDVELPFEDGHFYLCGPVPFMEFAKKSLLKMGVSDDRILYEVFGPHAYL